MATIYDAVTPKFTASRWTEDSKDREPYLLEAFWTERKQLGTEISSLKGRRPAVRPLDLSAFDVKVLPLERPAFEKVTTEMPFFKNSLGINEKMRQELLKVMMTGNQQYIDAVLGEVYNDNRSLLDNASVTREIMRAMLLTSGTINFENNGQSVSYDYGIPSTQKVTANWTDLDTADPLADFNAWQELVVDATGSRPNVTVMNTKTFNAMKKVGAIKDAIFVWGEGRVTPNSAKLREYLETEAQMSIYLYDKGYTDPKTKKFTKFVADGVIVMFTDGALGEFVYGTTPEEADLMSGSDAEVELVDLGVAITTIKEKDPVNVLTKVSMLGMPTLEKPEEMVIATVTLPQ